MKLGIVRLYTGASGKLGYYNIQELGLAKALEKLGVSTYIFFLVDKKNQSEVIEQSISNNIKIVYIPSFRIKNHGLISPEFLLNYNLDIVHLLSDNQIMASKYINFLKKNNIPFYSYIGTLNSDSNNFIKTKIMNILNKKNINAYRNSKVLAKTPDVKKVLLKNNIKDVKVIPVGLDLSIIPKEDKSIKELRMNLGLPEDKKILIFVGRLEEYKRPIRAIEILNKLLEKDKNYYLVVVGKGPLKDVLFSRVKELNILNNVKFIEEVANKDVHKYYRASDVFLNLNENEIFGMSLLEAMYQECNVVALKAPGPNYIIEDGISGILVSDWELGDFADKIIESNKLTELGKSAKRRIEKYLNWDVIAKEYIQLFSELIGEVNEKI
ncbi:glycosyltransferase [Clostridium perfringens]|uniref:glycosyltransferase family 4 protein n=1 Tax=Clostridium perfringens TaxID=1502 RepID=UPI001A2CD56F|nr:glycosyltransferase family 4 protein [Clostridium perfringens]MDK0893268.1 glycosyltransferase family 4 protein [Clostridium perfringens]MDT7984931.1 glycosyltransferase family 4 protein [Clostridium perfringens]MDT8040356.1 glycosyltransferase family 4 protein [Clostridium perfringens]MDZ5037217.1 glycosyltransferase [Clostridium perfringens]HAT4169010.1 glycosyltransferase family 4 protein [Clostridium perfringens]